MSGEDLELDGDKVLGVERRGVFDKVYIGDAVYASFDGYQICLSTERDGRPFKIFLEFSVFQNLALYVAMLEENLIAAQKARSEK